MITRRYGNLKLRREPAPEASAALEADGCVIMPGVLEADEIAAVFEATPPDREADIHGQFRHGMLNRSALSQKAIGSRRILDVIEPLLGEDCHVIANTAWRNIAGHPGGRWHIDAGPHVPRPEGVAWPDAIPYPIFAIGLHLFLEDCPLEAGPTAVVPGSHRSGRTPPKVDPEGPPPSYEGREPVLLTARAGDAALFVSDAWHRGTPAEEGRGRFFLQVHYARRDIAQRIMTTAESNHVTPEAAARAQTPRERSLVGLHDLFFYDA